MIDPASVATLIKAGQGVLKALEPVLETDGTRRPRYITKWRAIYELATFASRAINVMEQQNEIIAGLLEHTHALGETVERLGRNLAAAEQEFADLRARVEQAEGGGYA